MSGSNPSFHVVYHSDVLEKDIPRLSHPDKLRIKKGIETKLAHHPEEFGEPLRRTLKGYWKLRVGDYRIVYKIEGREIIIFRIGHRREVYEG